MELWRLHYRNGKTTVVTGDEKARLDGLAKCMYAGSEKATIHRCDSCGEYDAWRETWSWFGSYRDLDDGKPVIKLCSDACREAMIGDGRLPAGAPRLDD